MGFRVDIDKTIEAASAFIEKAGGRMHVIQLVKLMYLLDRFSLDSRGVPAIGGTYYSMKDGPVTSEVLDLINYDYFGVDNPVGKWAEFISERENHQVELKAQPGRNHLSDCEVDMIDRIWQAHKDKTRWQLVKWCHDNCPEWTEVTQGRIALPIDKICAGLGKNPEAIEHIMSDLDTEKMLVDLLG